IEIERSVDGRLVRLSGGGHVYVESPEPGVFLFDCGFVEKEQTELSGGFVRSVRTRDARWIETDRWDDMGRLVEVDGVRVAYDGDGRVLSCVGPDGAWHYGYSGAHLSAIGTPRGVRRIVRGSDGRALAWSENGCRVEFAYDASGRRRPVPRVPPGWNLDALGRLWTIADPDGRLRVTYLWDGWHCLGAIAGEPGDPLDAVHSLDPTGTPVRVVTRRGARRSP